MTDFLTRMADTVRSELRTAGLLNEPGPRLPLPHDLDAEGELCSAMLNGYPPPESSWPAPSDFYSRFNGYVWAAACAVVRAGREPTAEALLAGLDAQGVRGPGLVRALEELRDLQPYVCRVGLERSAERVRTLARARELIEELELTAVELRFGIREPAEAAAKLDRIVRATRERAA